MGWVNEGFEIQNDMVTVNFSRIMIRFGWNSSHVILFPQQSQHQETTQSVSSTLPLPASSSYHSNSHLLLLVVVTERRVLGGGGTTTTTTTTPLPRHNQSSRFDADPMLWFHSNIKNKTRTQVYRNTQQQP